MTEKQPLTGQERADLVAYLDGELTDDAARSREAKLSLDPAARAEADSLKRTWDLLDHLPKPEPSPSFTHRTLEKLTPIRTQAAPQPRKRRPWLVGVGWAAAVLAAAAAGYAEVSVIATAPANPEQDLTRDLRIIENKRFYDRVDDLEFLKQLDQPDLFGDDVAGS
jgi:anti-sigma factor RsiW